MATKPLATQRDLALAYTPGVAFACNAIAADESEAFRLTARGNLVAVITNGTAVLGLGNIGALASKPVMEGKAVLFKKFSGIDVFDIEINELDPDRFVDIVASLEPTFGGNEAPMHGDADGHRASRAHPRPELQIRPIDREARDLVRSCVDDDEDLAVGRQCERPLRAETRTATATARRVDAGRHELSTGIAREGEDLVRVGGVADREDRALVQDRPGGARRRRRRARLDRPWRARRRARSVVATVRHGRPGGRGGVIAGRDVASGESEERERGENPVNAHEVTSLRQQ
jgi:hypothetical protein